MRIVDFPLTGSLPCFESTIPDLARVIDANREFHSDDPSTEVELLLQVSGARKRKPMDRGPQFGNMLIAIRCTTTSPPTS